MAKKQNTLINGVAYSYVDMSILFEGLPAQYLDGFVGIPIQSIDYNATQQKTANYENSKYATAYSFGKVEFSGSITFSLDSFEFLRDQIFDATDSYSRSILDLPPVDITISYSNKGKANTHTIKNVIFTTENTSGSEGDDIFTVSCDFIASFIQYGDLTEVKTATIATGVKEVISGDNQI